MEKTAIELLRRAAQCDLGDDATLHEDIDAYLSSPPSERAMELVGDILAKHIGAHEAAREIEAFGQKDPRVDDLGALVRKLVHMIGPDNSFYPKVVDYLQKNGLQGSIMRDASSTPEAQGEKNE